MLCGACYVGVARWPLTQLSGESGSEEQYDVNVRLFNFVNAPTRPFILLEPPPAPPPAPSAAAEEAAEEEEEEEEEEVRPACLPLSRLSVSSANTLPSPSATNPPPLPHPHRLTLKGPSW